MLADPQTVFHCVFGFSPHFSVAVDPDGVRRNFLSRRRHRTGTEQHRSRQNEDCNHDSKKIRRRSMGIYTT